MAFSHMTTDNEHSNRYTVAGGEYAKLVKCILGGEQ